MDDIALASLIQEYIQWRTDNPMSAASDDYIVLDEGVGIHSELLGFAVWLEENHHE